MDGDRKGSYKRMLVIPYTTERILGKNGVYGFFVSSFRRFGYYFLHIRQKMPHAPAQGVSL